MPRSTGGVGAPDLFIGIDRMTAHATRPAERGRASSLEAAGLTPQRAVHWNLGPPGLYEHAVRRAEGVIAEGGAFCAVTAPHTGRSPNDKFTVREPSSADEVSWSRLNQPLEADHFERLKASVLAHLADRSCSCATCSSARTRITAWASGLSRRTRGTRCSSTTCSCAPTPPTSLRSHPPGSCSTPRNSTPI